MLPHLPHCFCHTVPCREWVLQDLELNSLFSVIGSVLSMLFQSQKVDCGSKLFRVNGPVEGLLSHLELTRGALLHTALAFLCFFPHQLGQASCSLDSATVRGC